MKTVNPAPNGSPGLAFGSTKPPYSPSRPHRGQDHQWRYADPSRSKHVYASVSGTVTAAYRDGGYHNGWGNYVDVTVPAAGHTVWARLAHHDSVSVNVGDHVVAGETFIGVMGDTGDTDGVHLHEELWIDGVRVDPVYYRTHDIPGTSGTTAGDGSSPFKPKEWDEMASQEEIEKAAYAGAKRALDEHSTTGRYSLVPIADDGNIYLVNNDNQKRTRVATPYHVQLIMRRLSNAADDVLLSAENDIVNDYISAVS